VLYHREHVREVGKWAIGILKEDSPTLGTSCFFRNNFSFVFDYFYATNEFSLREFVSFVFLVDFDVAFF